MKNPGNELLQFLGGLAMLIVGLYILAQKVMVSSSFLGGMRLGGLSMNNGMIIIPLIIGIIWMFASGGSFISKVFTGMSVLLIVAAIVISTNISLVHMSLYEWVIILVLIFGGVGILAKILLASRSADKEEKADRVEIEDNRKKALDIEKKIDKEIEQIKNEK
ncbi:MAG: hypothetical protein K2N85_04555 [Lachnospiraceae bacterium]|nr:hypothetical protein [Lachnospiraceae bacterium]